MKCPSTFSCPVEATLDLIGGKYKALILWHLIDNTLRFNEIGKLIPKVYTQNADTAASGA